MKLHWIFFIIFVIFNWLSGFAFANTGPADMELEFQHISIKEGLSQNTVNWILQDSRGFMWFGTGDGLNKYDGNRFITYYNEHQTNYSPASNNIRYIREMPDGRIMLLNATGKLELFDPKTETFSHFWYPEGAPASPGCENISAMYQSDKKTLWIGSVSGCLNRYDIITGEIVRYPLDPNSKNRLSNPRMVCIFMDREGILWITTSGGGLNRFDPMTGIFTHYKHDPRDPNSLSDNYVIVIRQGSEGMLWVGTVKGLDRFDPDTGKFTRFTHDPGDPASIGIGAVREIISHGGDEVWIATMGGGVSVFNPVTEKFQRFLHDPHNPNSLSSDRISSFYKSREGIIWVGTQNGGINKVDRYKKKFIHYRRAPNNANGLGNNTVSGIYEDKNGILWIAATFGGLNKFDRKSGVFTHYLAGKRNAKNLFKNYVVEVSGDRDGYIWVGTTYSGFLRFDPQTESFKQYNIAPGKSIFMGENSVLRIFEDSVGVMWIGTELQGLLEFDRETEAFTRYRPMDNDPQSISSNTIGSIMEDSTGTLWVGTLDNGLNKFHRNSKTFTRFQHDPQKPGSILCNVVYSVLQDSRGTLWIGTARGLNRFNPETQTFTGYTTRDGLANNCIYEILEDNSGRLWLSSNKGLSRFNPTSGRVKNYDPGDGLQGYEFNANAALKNKRGEMFFGGQNGFNLFSPDRIKDNSHIPPVAFTDFKIFYKTAAIGGDSPLKQHINYAGKIVLPYGSNTFSLEFAALDYTAPGKNQYKYRIEELNRDWVHLGNKHDLSFTGMEPGEYTLQVTGSNNDGIWNEQGASLKIIITPPFWRTWWFSMLALLVIAALVLLWHRQRMKHLEYQLKTETQMERIFNKFKVSPREQEIIRLVLKGKSNKEIEDTLYISLPTVKSHIYNAYKKLGVKSRVELIHFIQGKVKVS